MDDHLLVVDGLSVRFRGRRPRPWAHPVEVPAVEDVSFHIDRAETFGLVGESGSGKTTIGRALLRLVPPSAGRMLVGGRDVTALRRPEVLDFRRDLQVVFQDPYSSLNPKMVVADIVGEPLRVHHGLKGRARDDRVAELLGQVGLGRHHMERYPAEFSGGQRQRIAIARAIALHPELVICDEAVSALDVSTQSQVINLLEDLQAGLGLSYLFIAHDLAVVRSTAHRIGVLYLGRLLETGPAERIYEQPAHPYTEALLSAVPVPDPVVQRARRAARGARSRQATSMARPAQGCPYRPRCAHAMDVCATTMPSPTPVAGGGEVACHLYTTGPTSTSTSAGQGRGAGPVDARSTNSVSSDPSIAGGGSPSTAASTVFTRNDASP